MTAPPGRLAPTEPPVEHISGDREPDLSTKSSQERWLVHELGVTYCQAKALIRAYELDQERPVATAAKNYAPSFIDWLMRQAPTKRKPAVRKWQIGEAGWRTAT